eukprot:scaffold82842_cov51-Phaeocystis_antarctica.AAC.1
MSRAASRLCCSAASTSAPLLSFLGSFPGGHIGGEEPRELGSSHIGASQPALRFRLKTGENDNSFCAWHSRSGPLRKRFSGDSSPGG